MAARASAPDLERYAGDGFRVAAFYRPSLREPETATIIVTRYGLAVDVLETSPADALETYRHAGLYLERYSALLTAKAPA